MLSMAVPSHCAASWGHLKNYIVTWYVTCIVVFVSAQVPVCLLPAKYDPMDQMMLTIDLLQRQYAPRCIFKRFGKVS